LSSPMSVPPLRVTGTDGPGPRTQRRELTRSECVRLILTDTTGKFGRIFAKPPHSGRASSNHKLAYMAKSFAVLRLLIADDSSIVRERLRNLLIEVPHVEVVGETADVAGTIEAIRTSRPDVVILDINMPGGSGFDVLEMVRLEQLKTAVIVASNLVEPEYQRRALAEGARAFVDKSRDFMRVAGLVQEMVSPATRRRSE
jgi:CheY-like chemotaxis protein